MIENYQQKEIEYYDKEAQDSLGENKESGSKSALDIFSLASYKFLVAYIKNNFKGGRVLDYGCGMGVHLIWLSKVFDEVVGIDLSQNSLGRAKKSLAHQVQGNITLIQGDCENTKLDSNSFDVVFDWGTFSSLDLERGLKEIHRVLKPSGTLLGIETLGHNPLANLKRSMNVSRGKRTKWAADHIFKMEDLENVKKYFDIKRLEFFHIFSWMFFPLTNYPGGKFLLGLLQGIDRLLLLLFPFLKKYSFKVVFILKKK